MYLLPRRLTHLAVRRPKRVVGHIQACDEKRISDDRGRRNRPASTIPRHPRRARMESRASREYTKRVALRIHPRFLFSQGNQARLLNSMALNVHLHAPPREGQLSTPHRSGPLAVQALPRPRFLSAPVPRDRETRGASRQGISAAVTLVAGCRCREPLELRRGAARRWRSRAEVEEEADGRLV